MRLKFAAMGGIMLVVILLAIVLWPTLQGLFAAMGIQVLSWQRDLHRLLTLAITAFSDTPSSAAWGTLLGLSFFYGVFHAAGPGHGKAVLTTVPALPGRGALASRVAILRCVLVTGGGGHCPGVGARSWPGLADARGAGVGGLGRTRQFPEGRLVGCLAMLARVASTASYAFTNSAFS